MEYERRNLIFLKFCDSNFSKPGLCSKPTGEIVNFARFATVSSGEYRSFKTSQFVNYLTNRFHFVVRLYSDNAQMTSKRGEDKEVRYEPQASSVTDVLTTF